MMRICLCVRLTIMIYEPFNGCFMQIRIYIMPVPCNCLLTIIAKINIPTARPSEGLMTLEPLVTQSRDILCVTKS